MRNIHRVVLAVSLTLGVCALPARAHGGLQRVNHVIILMQENHSFDNYFGVLPYAPGTPYRAGPCRPDDHSCVDGLTCSQQNGPLSCRNSNARADGSLVRSFHLDNYCPRPDLNHEWPGSHLEANFRFPFLTWLASPNDGFVRANATVPADATMGYYDQSDLPFYYGLAQTFAISDRYFSSVIGPTFPNRSYGLAATSFGHLTTAEIIPPLPPIPSFPNPPTPVPPPGGYKPITGTILDLLDKRHVSWTNFVFDLPTTAMFRGLDSEHVRGLDQFFGGAAGVGASRTCALPSVSFVDPAFGDNTLGNNPLKVQFDEHPPSDIRGGQSFVSNVVNALRFGPCWADSVLFIVYDEHGGFYDHVAPARAPQGFRRNPDGIDPGQCADLSNKPASEEPGGGVQCGISAFEAGSICPGFTPTGDYPAFCSNFDQLGFRVPFIAVSPFSRPHYVSHRVADHTSMLAFIEKRFLSRGDGDDRPHLTARDQHAWTLEDLFDFERAPSRNALPPRPPDGPAGDHGCPLVPPPNP